MNGSMNITLDACRHYYSREMGSWKKFEGLEKYFKDLVGTLIETECKILKFKNREAISFYIYLKKVKSVKTEILLRFYNWNEKKSPSFF